ncbi:MAG: hypothetical protein D6795_17410 [Deltaproteobacteria bacterium]|nr:MAG: hypothetical protein D6795_17410 [Deltaproteobacteria bacterium]
MKGGIGKGLGAIAAIALGAMILYAPACPQECESNRDCARGEYCAFETGVCAPPGVCQERPEACTEIYDPVCGCDEETYDNACFAAMAGVSILHEGECERRQ